MAAALVDYSKLNGVEPMPDKVSDFFTFPGEGIQGMIDQKQIYIGSKKIASRAGCLTVPCMEEQKNGSTEGYVFMDGACVGAFLLSDACRTGASQALLKLKSMGIKTAMLTGDNHAAAMNVHNKLGGHAMDVVHAELLPEEKAELIQELKKDGPTAMVGDGMNDAPSLATADVGISMGISGSGVAVETGHVTLMSNDIGKIPQAILLARRTWRRVLENIALSIATKAGVLALAFAGHPLLWAAVGADVGTCMIVIFNSMRLLQGATEKASHCCGHKLGTDYGCHGHHHARGHTYVHDQETDFCSHGHGSQKLTVEDEKAHARDHVTHCCTGDSHGTATLAAEEEGCVSVGDIETGQDGHGHQDHRRHHHRTCRIH